MRHLTIAFVIQAVGHMAFGNYWIGAAFAIGLFAGREHAQAEYRWIERYGLGLRANMPWHGGFQGRVWGLKPILDLALPAAGVIIAAVVFQ